MVTLSNLLKTLDTSCIPKISNEEYRFLWETDRWDGPKKGILDFQDMRHYFERISGSEEEVWMYAIVSLSEEQLKEEERWHELFREKVGTHTDYDEKGVRSGEVRPQSMHEEFYGPYKESKKKSPIDYSKNEVVAFFEITPD